MKNILKNIFEDEGIKIKDKRVLDLFADDKEKVVKVVNSLAKEHEGSMVEKELCHIVDNFEFDDGYASLWAIVALGQIYSRAAVPSLLKAFDSDWDFWKEAAQDALTKITDRFGEIILDDIEEFIEKRLDNDPFSSRLFAYGPVANLKTNERAKKFLIKMFQEDDSWQGPIAYDLAGFGDERVLQLFRRAIEFAKNSGDEFVLNEIREAYCILDGVEFSYNKDRKELWEEAWEERWQFKLNELGKSEEELEAGDKKQSKKNREFIEKSENDKEFLSEIKKENNLRDNYPLCDFDIETYLSVRERNFVESSFEEFLRILGFNESITVEEVQKFIGKTINFKDALEYLSNNYKVFPSEAALSQFGEKFAELWDITPKEPYQGLSPEDVMILSGNFRLRAKVGRNEFCPCASGKKYKKCCGKNI